MIVDPDISMQLIEKRGEKKDIHEEDAEDMRQVHEASKILRKKRRLGKNQLLQGWKDPASGKDP